MGPPIDFGTIKLEKLTAEIPDDDVEQSLFDAQDEEVMREGERAAASRSQVTKDFFGEINPTPVDEPVPSEAPTTLREPADQSSP